MQLANDMALALLTKSEALEQGSFCREMLMFVSEVKSPVMQVPLSRRWLLAGSASAILAVLLERL